MRIVAAVPESPRTKTQATLLAGLFPEHEVRVATTREAYLEEVTGAEVLLSTTFFPVTAEVLAGAPGLRFIQVAGVGVDHVDLDAARGAGVTVASVAGANAVSVAEHVVMSALALTRNLVAAHEGTRAGRWPLSDWLGRARDLSGMTVGIVGLGRIGREVARRLRPFGVNLLYCSRRPLSPEEESELGVVRAELGDLLARSDIVTVHVPLSEDTRRLFDAAAFARMREGAFFINTARAEIVDEDALADALVGGRLAGAAVDVFSPEPPTPGSPLLAAPNTLLTPHGSGSTVDAQQRIVQGAVQNLYRYVTGLALEDVVVGDAVPARIDQR